MSTFTKVGNSDLHISITNKPDAVAIIDACDEEIARRVRSWNVTNKGYVIGRIRGAGNVILHRLLMSDELAASELERPEVDHINRDPLDNRRSNLRVVNKSTQNQSRELAGGSSRFPGVDFKKGNNKWRAHIRIDRKKRHLGYFHCELDAARCYRDAVRKIDQVIDFQVWRELDVKPEPKQMTLNNWIMKGDVNANQA